MSPQKISFHEKINIPNAHRPLAAHLPDAGPTVLLLLRKAGHLLCRRRHRDHSPDRRAPPFTYLWGDGSTGVSLKNASKGVYSATLTDASGATVAHSHILNSHELDVRLTGYLPSSYCNPTSGKLEVEPVGGVAPYTYLWSNGQTTAAATGLALNTYQVTVTDAAGCSALGEYSVGLPHASYYPTAGVQIVQQPNCASPAVGELSATMNYSGYEPYSFQWSSGATTASVTGLTVGSYSVTVTDALGCSSVAGLTLFKEMIMTGSTICNGTATGTASASLVNGVAPVSYAWSDGQTGPTRSGLANGTYLVTATDATGCSSQSYVAVHVPVLWAYDQTPDCYSGNGGIAYCYVQNDNATAYLWDNGATDSYANSLSTGLHTVTVTTALGCSLIGTVTVPPPLAPPFTIATAPVAADCANSLGGSLGVTVSGGISPYNFYAYGPNGSVANSPAALQNVAAGSYYIYVNTANGQNCAANIQVELPDAGGFNPVLDVVDLDCANGGYGSAAVLGVTSPVADYQWNMGATTPDVYSLTGGCYSVTVTGAGTCLRSFNFCVYGDKDSLNLPGLCSATATGKLSNDLGVPGCAGGTGIPYQLFETSPSGALTLTDGNGVFNIALTDGTFDIAPIQYDPADIACPAAGKYTVTIPFGSTQAGLDFHFLSTSPVDHRITQQALRTAQPGYPYSLRFKACNDGTAASTGTVSLDYGNLFGSLSTGWFAQHPGAFSLTGETAGAPENHATFSFPGIAQGGCEILQTDLLAPTSAIVGGQFLTRATITPQTGDPTPSNNSTSIYNAVAGSFDPNGVYAFPVRNGTPHDGGEILKDVDRTVTYQIFFQNEGTAAADRVIVRDTLDAALEPRSLRNISTSHGAKISIEDGNKVLVFQFDNIGLQPATVDYANSVGSIQYEIDLRPGLSVGTEVRKSADIYFDFNPPVATNENVLKIAESLASNSPARPADGLQLVPNPADDGFRFLAAEAGELRVFDTRGRAVLQKEIEPGVQTVDVSVLMAGIYFVQFSEGGRTRTGKLVVEH